VKAPVIEVHITNIQAREDFRHNSIVGRYCLGSIVGLGLSGYRLAVEALLENIKTQNSCNEKQKDQNSSDHI
jgi:3-dehydroquinate dehydratase-2